MSSKAAFRRLFLCPKSKVKRREMHPREKLLGIGKMYLAKGEPIPSDILARAIELGLSIEDFGEPSLLNVNMSEEGDNIYGTDKEDF